jgi:hypothetical protein
MWRMARRFFRLFRPSTTLDRKRRRIGWRETGFQPRSASQSRRNCSSDIVGNNPTF